MRAHIILLALLNSKPHSKHLHARVERIDCRFSYLLYHSGLHHSKQFLCAQWLHSRVKSTQRSEPVCYLPNARVWHVMILLDACESSNAHAHRKSAVATLAPLPTRTHNLICRAFHREDGGRSNMTRPSLEVCCICRLAQWHLVCLGVCLCTHLLLAPSPPHP